MTDVSQTPDAPDELGSELELIDDGIPVHVPDADQSQTQTDDSATPSPPVRLDRVGVVAIARNEGERLQRCLQAVVGRVAVVVYVDSGSTDGSVEFARALDVEVIELDLSLPFTAARARNAGWRRLAELNPDVQIVQFVDGDCELIEGYMESALTVLDANPKLAVVSGRRMERFPERTIYNRLCDMEWDTPVGEATACHGDATIRLEALQQVNGFREDLIAGEEPEMCVRLRESGWRLERIDADMTWHDADMSQFGQWWKRAVRAGHASAQGMALHGAPPEKHNVSQVRSIVLWGIIAPLLWLIFWPIWWPASILLTLAFALQLYRIYAHRIARGNDARDAWTYAAFALLGKLPNALGAMKFWFNIITGRQSKLIEYKPETRSARG